MLPYLLLFFFHPLKWPRKPSGNESNIEQLEAAYTETGPQARGGKTLPRQRHLRISATVPPSEDQQEHQANAKFTDSTTESSCMRKK